MEFITKLCCLPFFTSQLNEIIENEPNITKRSYQPFTSYRRKITIGLIIEHPSENTPLQHIDDFYRVVFLPFLVKKCHFQSENVISDRKVPFPVENVISGLKMSFPV